MARERQPSMEVATYRARQSSLTAVRVLVSACCVDDSTLQGVPGLRITEPLPAKAVLGYNENRNLLWGDLHVHTSQHSSASGELSHLVATLSL